MTGIDSTEKRKPLMDRLKDYGEFLAMLWLGTTVIAGFLWFFAANEIRTGAQSFLGIDALAESLSELADASATNARAVAALTPPLTVSEYDTLRSRVTEPCTGGDVCRYNIRVRRTHFGTSCGAPTVLARVVTDRNGLQHFVDRAPDARVPRRIDEDWTDIPLAFIAPIAAPEGVAEFHLHLSYECEGGTVEERTPRIVFQLTAQ